MKPLVLLIHGLKIRSILTGRGEYHQNSTSPIPWRENKNTEFHDLPLWLENDGCEVYLATYDSGHDGVPSIEVAAQTVHDQILGLATKNPNRKITIIAHSIGGLIIRAYIDGPLYKQDQNKLKHDFIEKVIMVGTPNNGTPYKQFVHYFVDYKNNNHFVGLQNLFSRSYIKSFNKKYSHKDSLVPYYVIVGNLCSKIYGRAIQTYISLGWGENDGACPVKSAFGIKNVAGKAIVPLAHENFMGKCYYEANNTKPNILYTNYIKPLIIDNDSTNFSKETLNSISNPWWSYAVLSVMWVLFSSVFLYLNIKRMLSRVKTSKII